MATGIDVESLLLIAILGLIVGSVACLCGLVHRNMFFPWLVPVLLVDLVLWQSMRGTIDNTGWREWAWLGLAYAGWNVPMLAAWRACSWMHQWNVRSARHRLGQCMNCGYDLTGNTSGVCPECGEVRGIRSALK